MIHLFDDVLFFFPTWFVSIHTIVTGVISLNVIFTQLLDMIFILFL